MIKSSSAGQTRKRHTIILVASARARTKSDSPLLRLARDHADILRRFGLETTESTGARLYGTGLFRPGVLKLDRRVQDGGMAQLAAVVARGECDAAILLMDPSDPSCDAVETRALKRVAIERKVRLITTYAAAQRWLTLEADAQLKRKPTQLAKWRPRNWRSGKSNVEGDEERPLLVTERTMALISHDKKKGQMVEFVKGNIAFLQKHDRILATGTTGWLLKLLFCAQKNLSELLRNIKEDKREKRILKVTGELLEEQHIIPESDVLTNRIEEVRKHLETRPSQRFSDILMPLPSGPDGGDVLVAEAIRENTCHSVIFFHDPGTAHAHSADIRLLENTAQLPGVYCECVNDDASARWWVRGLEAELKPPKTPSVNWARRLRREESLEEVITIRRRGDKDSENLGKQLARAAAGYFNQKLLYLAARKAVIRIGISWGWGSRQVLKELQKMKGSGLLEISDSLSATLVWSPLIGTITAEVSEGEASVIAEEFSRFYGGSVQDIPGAGFVRRPRKTTRSVRTAIKGLERADLVLTSASPWDENASLHRNTGLNPSLFPNPNQAVGTVSGIFLDDDGGEVSGRYVVVGLDYQGFRVAAERGAVILVCGGEERRPILRAALKAKLVSVLITTERSARAFLEE